MMAVDIARKLSGSDGLYNLRFKAQVNRGELITLYGPTGAGKSSVLRMLAGLMTPDNGYIRIEDETLFDSRKKINIKTQRRNIGMVFQDYSLFPNMTVSENLQYALDEEQDDHIIEQMLEVAELTKLKDKKPVYLSGGQKQRVALIRSLVRKPKVLLLDEPLSALDSDIRSRLQDYILDFHRQFSLTTIMVSHDLPEVMKMSKRVLVIENGLVSKDCAPQMLID